MVEFYEASIVFLLGTMQACGYIPTEYNTEEAADCVLRDFGGPDVQTAICRAVYNGWLELK